MNPRNLPVGTAALDADLPPHAAEPSAEATVVSPPVAAPTAIPVPPVARSSTVPASVERTGGEVAKQNVVHKASAPAPTPAKKKPAATTKKRRRPELGPFFGVVTVAKYRSPEGSLSRNSLQLLFTPADVRWRSPIASTFAS